MKKALHHQALQQSSWKHFYRHQLQLTPRKSCQQAHQKTIATNKKQSTKVYRKYFQIYIYSKTNKYQPI